jgi:hypothetical protein
VALMHGETALFDAACFTHLLKNLFKWADKTLPTEQCTCASKTSKNHRFTTPLPRNMHAWVYQLMHAAEALYLREKAYPGYCMEGEFPASVDTDAHAKARGNAIDYFCAELDIMLEHFQGNHAKCQHGALPPDAQVFACTAQITALSHYLESLKDSAPLLLSSVGVTHVQYLESNHAVIARVRQKGILMSAPASFLGEALALLQVQELQLAANGVRRSALLEISELVGEHLGFEFGVDESEVMAALQRRLNLKRRRSTAAFREQVGKWRARKRASLAKNKNKPGMSGAYASGGTAAAVGAVVA